LVSGKHHLTRSKNAWTQIKLN